MVMKRISLIMVLCLAVVLAAGLPAAADFWTPYYTLSDPGDTPPGPGGNVWAELNPSAMVWLTSGAYVWVGAENNYQANAVKTGFIQAWYQAGGALFFPSRLMAIDFAVGGQSGPRPPSWDDPSKTFIGTGGGYEEYDSVLGAYVGFGEASLNFFPQPGWEWVRFENVSGGTIYVDSALIYTFCNPVNPVPIPGAVWLLGSGLLGLVGAGYRRFRS
jgi:hypothetical protein